MRPIMLSIVLSALLTVTPFLAAGTVRSVTSVHDEIAFATNRDASDWEIYIMNDDGSRPRPLFRDLGAVDRWPSWAPDGRWIAFQSDRGGSFDIWKYDTETQTFVNLTSDLPGTKHQPAWSPDGRAIAFYLQHSGGDDIYAIDADGTNPRALTSTGCGNRDPTWSPDGTQIAFASKCSGELHTWLMNADGSNARDITGPGGAATHTPDWSPDGARLAVHSHRELQACPFPLRGNGEIWLIDPADASPNPFRVTNDCTNDEDPDWLPTGSRLAWDHDEMDPRFPGKLTNLEIVTALADGRQRKQITDLPPGDVADYANDSCCPTWRPRPQLLADMSLEQDADDDRVPDGWSARRFGPDDGLVSSPVFRGRRALQLTAGRRRKALTQSVTSGTGQAGDAFLLAAWSMASGATREGFYRFRASLHYQSGAGEEFLARYNPAVTTWQYRELRFQAAEAWDGVTVAVEFGGEGATGRTWFDLIALLGPRGLGAGR